MTSAWTGLSEAESSAFPRLLSFAISWLLTTPSSVASGRIFSLGNFFVDFLLGYDSRKGFTSMLASRSCVGGKDGFALSSFLASAVWSVWLDSLLMASFVNCWSGLRGILCLDETFFSAFGSILIGATGGRPTD